MSGQKTQYGIYPVIYRYLENVDFDNLFQFDTVPPVELMQMKSICECLVRHKKLMEELPCADKITKLIDHFISVDKRTTAKNNQRIKNDKKRYQKNKNK